MAPWQGAPKQIPYDLTSEPKYRRGENMVGVNMVLAEYNQIQTWLL